MPNVHKMTEVICRQANDFRTDGIGSGSLSFTIMSLHIDFPAASHPEMASDEDVVFAELFLTDYCKALSRAFFTDYNFHIGMIFYERRARSGLK